jgi:hypothetical protein
MLIRNSALDLVFCIRVTSSSIASGVHVVQDAAQDATRRYSSGSISISSRRVPLRLMSMAGQIRLSTSGGRARFPCCPCP